MNSFNFKYGDDVSWNSDNWKTNGISRGRVVGYASIQMAVMGAMVIIDCNMPISKEYLYPCIVLPEIALALTDFEKDKSSSED